MVIAPSSAAKLRSTCDLTMLSLSSELTLCKSCISLLDQGGAQSEFAAPQPESRKGNGIAPAPLFNWSRLKRGDRAVSTMDAASKKEYSQLRNRPRVLKGVAASDIVSVRNSD